MTTRTPAVRLLAAAAVGALALAACAGGTDEGSSPLSTAATTTTTIQPATTTTPPQTATTTTRPRATPTTSVRSTTPPRPPTGGGVARVTALPSRGPVGTRVHIEGNGFTDEHWRAPGATLWLTGSPPGCALYAQAAHTVRVTAGGHLSGDFTVPARGECRQSATGDALVTAGRYQIAFQCTACLVGDFEVTAG